MTQAGLEPDAPESDDNAAGGPDALEPERREWQLGERQHGNASTRRWPRWPPSSRAATCRT